MSLKKALYQRLLSPGGGNARLSTLIFHRVLPAADPLQPDVVDRDRFRALLELLASTFHFLPPLEAVERLARRDLPPGAFTITFDDGYEDNYTVAQPELARAGFSAAYFVASDYLDGGLMFNDVLIECLRVTKVSKIDLRSLGLDILDMTTEAMRRKAISTLIGHAKYLSAVERKKFASLIQELSCVAKLPKLMMSSSQLRALASAGGTIGGHTASHPILKVLSPDEASRDIESGRDALSKIIEAPILLFAYPNGQPDVDYDVRHVRMVRDLGFVAAFTTSWGVARCSSDFYQMPRFTPWDQSAQMFAARMIINSRSDSGVFAS